MTNTILLYAGTADVCNGFGDCVGTGYVVVQLENELIQSQTDSVYSTACTLCPNSCDEQSKTCPCPPGVDSTGGTTDPGSSDTSGIYCFLNSLIYLTLGATGAEFIRFSIELVAIAAASLLVL